MDGRRTAHPLTDEEADGSDTSHFRARAQHGRLPAVAVGDSSALETMLSSTTSERPLHRAVHPRPGGVAHAAGMSPCVVATVPGWRGASGCAG